MISFSQKQKLSQAIGKITYMFNAATERCWFQAHETQRKHIWRGGRVVECTGLENRRRFSPSVGSNPTASANGLDFLWVFIIFLKCHTKCHTQKNDTNGLFVYGKFGQIVTEGCRCPCRGWRHARDRNNGLTRIPVIETPQH